VGGRGKSRVCGYDAAVKKRHEDEATHLGPFHQVEEGRPLMVSAQLLFQPNESQFRRLKH